MQYGYMEMPVSQPSSRSAALMSQDSLHTHIREFQVSCDWRRARHVTLLTSFWPRPSRGCGRLGSWTRRRWGWWTPRGAGWRTWWAARPGPGGMRCDVDGASPSQGHIKVSILVLNILWFLNTIDWVGHSFLLNVVTGGRVAQAAVRAAGLAVEGAGPDLQDLRLPPPQQAVPRPGGRRDQAGARGENNCEPPLPRIMSDRYIWKCSYRFNQLEKLEAAKAAWLVCLCLHSLTGSYWALLGLTGPYWAF